MIIGKIANVLEKDKKPNLITEILNGPEKFYLRIEIDGDELVAKIKRKEDAAS